VVDESVDGGRCRHGVLEDAIPLREDEVARDDHAAPFVALGEEGEEDLHLIAVLLHVADVVDNDGVILRQPFEGAGQFQVPLGHQQLLVAKRDLELPRALKRLSKYDALVIDDIGYVQQDREEMEVLFTLLADRYERGSVLITSNLPFSKWERIFKDPMTTAAAIDRLVHHSVILELNLPSYRLEQSKKGKKKGGKKEINKETRLP
jgi:hypothetical protein